MRQNFYIYKKITGTESGKLVVEGGVAERVAQYNDNGALANAVLKALNQSKSKQLLIFIHGYFADFAPVNKEMCFVIDQDILGQREEMTVLHLQWQSKLWYPSNHEYIQSEVAPEFANLLDVMSLSMSDEIKYVILTHSMGGFVLEKLIDLCDLVTKTDACILAAPDMNAEQFIASSFMGLDPEKVMVLTCNSDKTLAIANFLKPFKRLGVSGDMLKEIGINFHEVKDFSEEELIIGKLLKHRYFYTNKKVRTFIANQLKKVASDKFED